MLPQTDRIKEVGSMKQNNFGRMRVAGRILSMIFAFTLAAGCAAGSMLEANADQVNNFLGTRTTATKGNGDYEAFTPDEKYLNSDGSANTDALVAAHIDMGTRIAEEGSVLLKNKDNAALPLAGTENVTLMGYRSTAAYAVYGMDIGSPEEASQNVSFKDALTAAGFKVNNVVCSAYNTVSATDAYTAKDKNRLAGTGYYVESITSANRYNVAEPSIDEIKTSAGEQAFNDSIRQYKDAGIVVLGRPSSEQGDYYTGDNGRDAAAFSQSKTKNVLSLSDGERALIEFAKQNFDKVVVVLTTANPMELSELEADEGVDAILWAGYPGNYGFYGVANILAGKANPSGRLADTFAADTASTPAMQNYGLYLYTNGSSLGGSNGLNSNDYYGGAYIVHAEGIYSGYKYYETRYEDTVLSQGNATSGTGIGGYNTTGAWNYADEVTYSFGYGLSYTTFTQTITDVEFSPDNRTATVSVAVKNDGDVDGKSVIQIYGQSPYTQYDKDNGVEKASVQLLAYDKVEVAAGATVNVDVEVDMQYLASYDSKVAKSYIMEQADGYYFALGCNSQSEGAHAAINNILAAKAEDGAVIDTSKMDETGNADAVYKFRWTAAEDTFATSEEGATITNQLDDMDYNYYQKDTVQYLSRSNWQSSWPKSYTGLSVVTTTDMLKYLTNDFHTTTDTDTEGIVFGAEGETNFTDMFLSDFNDERWSGVIDKITLENAVRFTASGNRTFQQMDEVYFLSGNSYVENGSVGIQKTLSQQSDMNAPWYVDPTDENAGFYCNSFGGATLMASTWSKQLMEEMGELWGNDALFVNIPMVWAPSINMHRTPYNGRNGEYYSEDGVLSGYTALSVGSGAISKGLITSIKHFAFNEQETARNGISTYMNEQTAREGELRGFQIALEGYKNAEGKRISVLGIMTGYNRAGAIYAGAHQGLMQGILRDEWDFNGYVTSDLAQSGSTYMPYIESILAGTTNFDTAINNDSTVWRISVADLVEEVSGDAEVLRALKEDLHYSLWAFSQSNLANWMTDTTRVVWVWNWWRGAYIGTEIVSGILVAAGVVMYIYAVAIGPWREDKKNRLAAQAERSEKQ